MSSLQVLPAGETLIHFALESEKYIHHLAAAFRKLNTDKKCVIVGDAAHAEDYKAKLYALAENDPRIVISGYVFSKWYQERNSMPTCL